jgi:hypothetical protein
MKETSRYFCKTRTICFLVVVENVGSGSALNERGSASLFYKQCFESRILRGKNDLEEKKKCRNFMFGNA